MAESKIKKPFLCNRPSNNYVCYSCVVKLNQSYGHRTFLLIDLKKRTSQFSVNECATSIKFSIRATFDIFIYRSARLMNI